MYEREAAAAAATYATGTGIGTSPGERLSFYACMRGIEERHKAAGAVRCCGVEYEVLGRVLKEGISEGTCQDGLKQVLLLDRVK